MRTTRPAPPRVRRRGRRLRYAGLGGRRRLARSCDRLWPRRRFRCHGRCSSRVVPALVEPERRIGVGHQARIRDDPRHPAVEAEDEVEETARIPRHEQKRDRCEEHEGPDEPAPVPPVRTVPVLGSAGSGAGAAEEDPQQDVLGDREQPPLHQDEATREPLRVGDVERRRVVGCRVERERRVAVGAEGAVRVVRDAPGPAQHAEVEVEDAPRVAPGEQDREEGDDREHHEGDPEEEEHDEVRDRQQPLHEPEPAAQLRIQTTFEPNRVGGAAFHPRTSSMPRSGQSLRCVARCRLQEPGNHPVIASVRGARPGGGRPSGRPLPSTPPCHGRHPHVGAPGDAGAPARSRRRARNTRSPLLGIRRMLGSMPGNGTADSFAVSMQWEGVDDRPAGDRNAARPGSASGLHRTVFAESS